MSSFVLDFQEIEKGQLSLVGGKGLNLGELSNIQGIEVPEGFCVTTVGYEKAIEQNENLQTLLQQLTKLKLEDRAQIGEMSKEIREVIIAVQIPS
ncbi:PEP/pyruvate-binding domain-containing protein, partial [Bacillus cereus group sp. Bce025]